MAHQASTPIDVLRHMAVDFPTFPVLRVPKRTSPSSSSYEYWDVSIEDLQLLTDFFAVQWTPQLGQLPPLSTVAFIASSVPHYFAAVLAVMGHGLKAFVMNPRSPPNVLTGLLVKSQADAVLTTPDFEQVARDAAKETAVEKKVKEEIPVITFGTEDATVWDIIELQRKCPKTFKDRVIESEDLEEVSQFALHSSGSTGIPRIISLPHRALLKAMPSGPQDPSAGIAVEGTATGQTERSVCLLEGPYFHLMGCASLMNALVAKKTYALPSTWPPKAIDVLTDCEKANATNIFAVPIVLEDLGSYLGSLKADPQQEKWWNMLRGLTHILYGGAHLPSSAASVFAKHGALVRSAYGSSECGSVMTGLRLSRDVMDHEGMILLPSAPVVFESLGFNEEGEEMLLLVVKAGNPSAALGIANRDDGSFATGDVFVERPKGSGVYYIQGRSDDQLVHSTGEKTFAQPIELELKNCPHIHRVCIVGHQRLCPAALIELTEDSKRRMSEEESMGKENADESVRREVLDFIRRVNEGLPTHSRVLEELVAFLPEGRRIPTTVKGNVQRKAAVRQLEDVYDPLYRKFLGAEGVFPTRTAMGFTEMLTAVRRAVAKALEKSKEEDEVPLDMPFIELGVDSLTAARIAFSLRETVGEISGRLVFEFPTVRRLAMALLQQPVEVAVRRAVDAAGLKRSEGEKEEEENLMTLGLDSLRAAQLMFRISKDLGKDVPRRLAFEYPSKALLQKAVFAFLHPDCAEALEVAETPEEMLSRLEGELMNSEEARRATDKKGMKKEEGEVVLITGVSGAIGSFLVVYFSQHPAVRKVVCMLRGDDPKKRLQKALKARGLPVDFVQDTKKVEVLSLEMGEETLGTPTEVWERLREEVTAVVHNAWKVNFNSPLREFESECLRSVLTLLRFCLPSSKSLAKRFYFISSISAVGGMKEEVLPEDFPPRDSSVALDMGYGHSKWVGELLCKVSLERLHLDARIIRCTQIAGDSKTGSWNPNEMVPLTMIGGAGFMKKMPAQAPESHALSWVPLDTAARAISEIVMAKEAAPQVTQISNPHPVEWDTVLEELRHAGLSNFEVISSSQWAAELLLQPTNPAFKLSGVFQAMYIKEKKEAEEKEENGREKEKELRHYMSPYKTCEVSPTLKACPPIDRHLLRPSIDYWRSLGLLEEGEG